MKHVKLFEYYNRNFIIGYHGTNKNFDKFNQGVGIVSTIFGTEEVVRHGFFFAENINFSRQFGESVLECRLNINNTLDATSGFSDDDIAKLVEAGISESYLYSIPTLQIWEAFDESDIMANAIKAIGYDSVVMLEEDYDYSPQKVYIVFDENDIEILRRIS